MTMDPQLHPEDERLSELAARDGDAAGDAVLVAHVDACDRCRSVVHDLALLRSQLAQLPDLAPARPIRIVLPPREPAPAERVAATVRRLFAPLVAAGATLALVGAVGLGSLGPGGAGSAARVPAGEAPADTEAGSEMRAPEPDAAGGEPAADGEEGGITAAASSEDRVTALTEEASPESAVDAPEPQQGPAADESASESLTAPWLAMLIAGIALAAAALVLRFVVVPRAG